MSINLQSDMGKGLISKEDVIFALDNSRQGDILYFGKNALVFMAQPNFAIMASPEKETYIRRFLQEALNED